MTITMKSAQQDRQKFRERFEGIAAGLHWAPRDEVFNALRHIWARTDKPADSLVEAYLKQRGEEFARLDERLSKAGFGGWLHLWPTWTDPCKTLVDERLILETARPVLEMAAMLYATAWESCTKLEARTAPPKMTLVVPPGNRPPKLIGLDGDRTSLFPSEPK